MDIKKKGRGTMALPATPDDEQSAVDNAVLSSDGGDAAPRAIDAAPSVPAPAAVHSSPADMPEADLEEMRKQQADAVSVMAGIKNAADALSPEAHRHLHSHLLANALHDVNEKCFTEVDSFKQMTLTFYNLRANSKAFLSIRPDQHAIWSEGGKSSRMIGLSFSSSNAGTLYLRNFLINAREMFMETYQDCSEVNIGLYVRTDQAQLRGRVDLPPGASVTLQSRCDRSSVIGLSSFAVDLE